MGVNGGRVCGHFFHAALSFQLSLTGGRYTSTVLASLITLRPLSRSRDGTCTNALKNFNSAGKVRWTQGSALMPHPGTPHIIQKNMNMQWRGRGQCTLAPPPPPPLPPPLPLLPSPIPLLPPRSLLPPPPLPQLPMFAQPNLGRWWPLHAVVHAVPAAKQGHVDARLHVPVHSQAPCAPRSPRGPRPAPVAAPPPDAFARPLPPFLPLAVTTVGTHPG